MRHGSLFSGIGGFDLAARWVGWENVFHCEWNEFGQKVLKYYWPNAISYGDITKTDFTKHRGTIDIISGGFPCQPYSTAGKRLGTADDRHLWPEMLRAIREIQPGWVVGENVRGLTNWNGGLVFDQVQADLEAEGYQVLPFLLPACAVDAPHRRDRIWFVAYNSNAGTKNMRGRENSIYEFRITPDTTSNAITGQNGESVEIERERATINEQVGRGQLQTIQSEGFYDLSRDVTDTDIDIGCERGMHKTRPQTSERHISSCHTRSDRETWRNFPTQSPIRSRNDGLSSRLSGITFPKWRNESIKAMGNSIVPQVAYQIFKAIDQFEFNK